MFADTVLLLLLFSMLTVKLVMIIENLSAIMKMIWVASVSWQTQGPFVSFVLERELIPHRHVAESVIADGRLLRPRCVQPTVRYAGSVSQY